MAPDRLRVLILGGYGIFGGRLARMLADEPRLTLIVAGRSRAKADAFCAALPARAAVESAEIDRSSDLHACMTALSPDVVVDASGPFQAYGDAPYRVIETCLAVGADYLDLADGSDFVAGIARFDQEARRKDWYVLTGVSSFPVLTAAVVRRLSSGLSRIDSVTGGIAPSPYAGVGLNVIEAIASYAGRPVAIGGHENREHMGHALVDACRYTIAPPGSVPLGPIRFSLVDVPDLKVLPELWPSLRRVWMGAGPVPAILHRALNALAWTVRARLIGSLSAFAPLMYRTINVLRWGEHRGGMFVSVAGEGPDGPVERSWHLLAEGDDGPLIPSMAAEAIIRRCLAGRRPAAGARAATGDLELADYEALFAKRTIVTGVRETSKDGGNLPLYRRLLGDAYACMPQALQAMHDLGDAMTVSGRATVERGRGLLARLVATAMGFPRDGIDVPVTVDFRGEHGRERWRRTFAGRRFGSIQEEGSGGFERLLCERFGPLSFGIALVTEDDRLRLIVRKWRLFGVPLPSSLAPGGDTYEHAADGRFNFHVEIAHKWTGLIVRYRGWLEPSA